MASQLRSGTQNLMDFTQSGSCDRFIFLDFLIENILSLDLVTFTRLSVRQT